MTGLLSKVQRKPTSKMGQPGAGWSERAIWEKQTNRGADSAWSPTSPHRAAFVFLIQSPAAYESPKRQGLGQALLRPGSRALLRALQGGVSAGEVLGKLMQSWFKETNEVTMSNSSLSLFLPSGRIYCDKMASGHSVSSLLTHISELLLRSICLPFMHLNMPPSLTFISGM